MKAALIQQALPSSPTQQNWSNIIFSNDAKALLLFGCRSATNNSNSANGTLSIGCTDKTNLIAMSMSNVDAVAESVTNTVMMSGRMYALWGLGTNTSEAEADLSGVSHPSDGLQINWPDIALGDYLINGLLLGGDDIEVSCVTANFTGGGAGQTIAVSHQLSGEPDVIIAFANGSIVNVTGEANRPNGGYVEIGFYDVVNGTYASINSSIQNAAPAAVDANYVSDAFLFGQNNAGTLAYQVTVSSFGASTFNMTTSANTSDGVMFICIRGINSRLSTKAGIATTPTSTGSWTPITGMPSKPQVVFWLPTRMTAINAHRTNDEAGHVGFAVSVDHPSGTQQAVTVASDDDAAATIVAKNQISNTKSLLVTSNLGVADFEASVTSWNADGVTLNVSNAAASALRIPYLAIGAQVSEAPPFIHRTKQNTLLRM